MSGVVRVGITRHRPSAEATGISNAQDGGAPARSTHHPLQTRAHAAVTSSSSMGVSVTPAPPSAGVWELGVPPAAVVRALVPPTETASFAGSVARPPQATA